MVDSTPVIARALELLGRRTSEVERIVLSHFHDDHAGSAATVAQWSPSTVVAGRADTPFVRGRAGAMAGAHRGRVDHEAADGDVLGFAGGAIVLHVGEGHTPGSIALPLPRLGVLLTEMTAPAGSQNSFAPSGPHPPAMPGLPPGLRSRGRS